MIAGCIYNAEEEVELRSKSPTHKSIYLQRQHLRISIHSYQKALGHRGLRPELFSCIQELLHLKISSMSPQAMETYSAILSLISKLLEVYMGKLNLRGRLWKLYDTGICLEESPYRNILNLLVIIPDDL